MADRKTYQDLMDANGLIKTTPIHGKDYAEVPQRIKAFRSMYPDGAIVTEILKDENGEVTFKASVYARDDFGEMYLLGTGTAREKEGSSRINSGSHVENAETSAVGRALGMAGYGIDTSVASYEEVKMATEGEDQQEERKATPKQVAFIKSAYQDPKDMERLLLHFEAEVVEDLTITQASEIISRMKGEK